MDTQPQTDLAIPASVVAAVRKIVDYSWAAEAADFERWEDEDGFGLEPDHHVFHALRIADDWLRANGVT